MQSISTNTFGVARWIVSADPTQGSHTTIAGAIASASSGDTIFIRDGIYTEDLTLKIGVDLVALEGDDDQPNVTIIGKCTFTGAGSTTLACIRLQTNSDFCLAVTGSAASVVKLSSCFINAANNTSISYSSSSASSAISFVNCSLTVTSGACFASSGAGSIGFSRCNLSQSTSTANTISAGIVLFHSCFSGLTNIVTSGTADFQSFSSHHTAGDTVGPYVTHGGTGANSYVLFSEFQNNSAGVPAISVSAGATLKCGQITATNFAGGVASISGAGAITYSEIGSLITTNTITVSTQTKNPIDTGLVRSTNGITFDGGTTTLSNYEIGTWTPTLIGTVAGVTTYTRQVGYYTRIGNLVTVWADIVITAATGTGGIVLGGLPFTVKNQVFYQPNGACLMVGNATWVWPAGGTSASVFGAGNNTTCAVYVSGTGVAGGVLAMANAALTISYTLTYQI